jgi:hypothetical protein
MSDTLHAAKKPKPTTTAGPPLYSELDLAQLTVDATLLGSNETRFATVKYKDTRLVYQLAGVGEAMRVPFGVDDGSKFGSKASMKLELSDAQLAFVRAVEDKVIDTAVKNKAEWFAGVKPPPSDGEVRKAFSSRVSVDPDGQYEASLRVNVHLADDAKKLKVSTTRRLGDGKIEAPKRGSAADVQWGDCAVPVLQTAGGVWVKKTKKLTDNCFGLIFEASEVLVIKGADEAGAGAFNLGDVEVAEPAPEAAPEETSGGGEGGFGGQFY